MNAVQIASVTELPEPELSELIAESESDGFKFVRRLRDEWNSEITRFDQPGEAIFVARLDGQLIGICGLNRDPYSQEASVGRVRRLYVRKEFRRLGVGRQLVQTVVKAAHNCFSQLCLRTDNPVASKFYERLGFQLVADSENSTHWLPFDAV